MRIPTWRSVQFRYLHPWVVATAAGVAGALAVSALLVPARGWLGNTNVALLLVGVVVAAAAFGGRIPGVITALAASLAFNATHTVPYGTLVIENREDIITTVLVAVVGIAVGELTHLRINAARHARRRDYAISRIHRVAELVRHAAPLADVLAAIDTELGAELGTRSVELHPGNPDPSHVELRHAGIIDGPDRTAFPAEGLSVSVNVDGDPSHHLELRPGPHASLTDAGSIVAIVMADLLGATLSSADRGPDPS